MARLTVSLTLLALACTTLLSLSTLAIAEPNFQSRAGTLQGPDGGGIGRAARGVQGSHGSAGGTRRVAADGKGNVNAAGARGFTTESGAYGGQSGSFSRTEDGSASGNRSTTAYNPNTGKTFEGSTTYTQGEGATRTASCKDSSGNTVACGNR